jgi:hypothetical protein
MESSAAYGNPKRDKVDAAGSTVIQPCYTKYAIRGPRMILHFSRILRRPALCLAALASAALSFSAPGDPVPTAPPPTPAAAPAPASAAAPVAAPYAFLQSFVGGSWLGPLPAGKDGGERAIELHFAWAENKRGVRFASAIVNGKRRAPYVSGMYAWNAAKGKLEIFYTDSGGSLAEGLATQDGDALVEDLIETNSDKSVDTVRVKMTKIDDDTFTNEIFILEAGNYGKIAEVRYERQQDAAHQP